MTHRTPPAADEGLPHAQNKLLGVAEGATWAQSLQELNERSRRTAWRVASASAVLALVGFGGWVFGATRPVLPPTVITVDRHTGEYWVAGPFDERSVPQLTVLDQHWAEAFFEACESYHFNMMQRSFDQCARMSSPKVFGSYAKDYTGHDAKQQRMGDREDDSVSIVSVRSSLGTQPGRQGEVIVTFDKAVTIDGHLQGTTRYVGVCEFEYHPQAMTRPVDRLENPLGFICTDERKDAEVSGRPSSASPASPAASAAATTPGQGGAGSGAPGEASGGGLA